MSLLRTAYTRLIEGLATAAGLMLAGVCLLIVYDVIARNLGFQPPASTVALTEYALLYFTMAAAPWLVRTRGHIVVEVVHTRLTGSARKTADWLVLAICFAVSTCVSLLALVLLLEAAQRGEIEIRSLEMPRTFLFAPLVVGFGLMAVEFLCLALNGETVTDSNQQQESL